MDVAPRLPLTDECHHYYGLEEVPWDIQKYWHQRYSIFSLYDDGVQLTDDAWFGVTPEPVAVQIAEDISYSPGFIPAAAAAGRAGAVLIDLFAGAGGNVIAFTQSGHWQHGHIIAIERDAATLACAQHNAEVYGVDGLITWVHGDSFAFLDLLKKELGLETEAREKENGVAVSLPGAGFGPDLRAAIFGDGYDGGHDDPLPEVVLFASPPWGGVEYRGQEVFDLSTMQPYNLAALHEACAPLAHALYLPRTSDLRQIARLAPPDRKIEVVQYCVEGASKAMVAYIPAAAASDDAA